MNPQMLRGAGRIAAEVFALVTVMRSLRRARDERDTLRIFDAAINALAVATTVAILVRELRERRSRSTEAVAGDVAGAVEDVAP